MAAGPFRRPAAFLEYFPPLGWRIDFRLRVTTLGMAPLSSSPDGEIPGLESVIGVWGCCISDDLGLPLFRRLGALASESSGDCDFLFLGRSELFSMLWSAVGSLAGILAAALEKSSCISHELVFFTRSSNGALTGNFHLK